MTASVLASAVMAGMSITGAGPASATTVEPAQPVPGTDYLQGVDCPTATSCVAVGQAILASGGSEGVIVPIVNGKAGDPVPAPGTGTLLAVACGNANKCFAIGSTFSGDFRSFVLPIVNGVPGEPVLVPSGTGLYGIDCVSKTDCLAVGSTTADGVTQGALVPVVDGTPGTPQPVAGTTQFNGVACPAAGNCVVVGQHQLDVFSSEGVVVTITDGTPGTPQPVGAALNAVACESTTTCEAVGRDEFFIPIAVEIVNGTPGAPQQIFVNVLLGIDCPRTGVCEAVGSGNDESGSLGVVVPIFDGVPGKPRFASGSVQLYSVSCGDASTCVAVGGQTGAAQYGVVARIVEPDTALDCITQTTSTGSTRFKCTLTDPDGIHSVVVTAANTGERQYSATIACSSAPTTFKFSLPANTTYRVTVTDCHSPRQEKLFRLQPPSAA